MITANQVRAQWSSGQLYDGNSRSSTGAPESDIFIAPVNFSASLGKKTRAADRNT